MSTPVGASIVGVAGTLLGVLIGFLLNNYVRKTRETNEAVVKVYKLLRKLMVTVSQAIGFLEDETRFLEKNDEAKMLCDSIESLIVMVNRFPYTKRLTRLFWNIQNYGLSRGRNELGATLGSVIDMTEKLTKKIPNRKYGRFITARTEEETKAEAIFDELNQGA